ncbi:MAG: ABC-F family ATP-binding cassette domain-containing protein [Ahrensia sp.]
MLQISNLTFRMVGRTLFDGASATIPAGAKCGLVGRNGTGKTTLFKMITGELQPESGSITLPTGLRFGQVAQEAPGTQVSLLDTVLEADTERTALMAEAETATDPERIAAIHTRLNDIDAHSAEARAGSILHGLGFSAEAQRQPCSSFSGGWRMRVALAAVLFSEPDLLLLDEPTNYLDLEGTMWLENYIQRYRHTVLLISHDRDLLNSSANSILHLEGLSLTFYRGNYEQFARARAEKMMQATKMKEKQDAKRKHMEAFVERFRAKASKARQAQSRLKALSKLADVALISDEPTRPLHFPSPDRQAASPIINLERVSVGYADDKPVLKGLDLRIDADDRIALLGANGNGKSTFAKLIADRLAQQQGRVTRADKLRVAMFAQHQLDDLNPAESAFDHVRALVPDEGEAKVRARVAGMGLGTEKMDTPVRELSGGERARLTLGLATFHKPHLLILDEPTNHLDMDSRSALIEALNAYEGAVILVSHDRHLLEASAERLWLVGDGTVQPYDGDLDDYRNLLLKGPAKPKKPEAEKPQIDDPSGKERRQHAANIRAKWAPFKQKIDKLEQMIALSEKDLKRIDEMLMDPKILENAPRYSDLSRKRSMIVARRDKAEEQWMEMSTEYEAVMAAL